MWMCVLLPGAPGFIMDCLLTGVEFVKGWQRELFVAKWSMHQLVSSPTPLSAYYVFSLDIAFFSLRRIDLVAGVPVELGLEKTVPCVPFLIKVKTTTCFFLDISIHLFIDGICVICS